MVCDIISANLWHYLNCSNFDQIWNSGPLTYCRNTLKHTRTIPNHLKPQYVCESQNYGNSLKFPERVGVEKSEWSMLKIWELNLRNYLLGAVGVKLWGQTVVKLGF